MRAQRGRVGLYNLALLGLDLERLGAWSLKRQACAALFLVGGLLALGYAFLHAPLARLELQRSAEAGLKTEFEAKAAQVASLDSQVLHVRALETSLDTLLKQLPRQAEVPGLLEDVSRLGLVSGLDVEQIQWLPEVLQPFYTELPMQLTLVGGYHDLGLFISGLVSFPRIVTVHDFTLAPLSDGPLRMTLLAKTYRANDQGLIP